MTHPAPSARPGSESPRWAPDGSLHGAKWSRRYALLTKTLASPATASSARVDALFGMSDLEYGGIDPAVGIVQERWAAWVKTPDDAAR